MICNRPSLFSARLNLIYHICRLYGTIGLNLAEKRTVDYSLMRHNFGSRRNFTRQEKRKRRKYQSGREFEFGTALKPVGLANEIPICAHTNLTRISRGINDKEALSYLGSNEYTIRVFLRKCL